MTALLIIFLATQEPDLSWQHCENFVCPEERGGPHLEQEGSSVWK